ncbi:(2Fe-2S)-binding protein [Streptacidiphilus sp. N8-3]|uniref:(2Fe-2S)-binding protein n=1 Tax=Streptacidiphilus cavernicola TaxID=3342716 RepID=A0ABV6VZW3_9ACTN
MTDYLTNPAALGIAEGMGMTGMNDTSGFGGESPRVSYTLRVNGLERPVNEAWIGESLLYVLRERLGLAGAKGGCDQGECGACSVQLDGQLTAACLVPAALAADSEIRTVEGLTADGGPSDVQRALAESGAVQCGYCVPGLAMAVHDLLERNHKPTELQAREALCGNLCRCTGYRGALAAVQAVARSRAEEAASTDDPDAGGTAETAAAEESGSEGSYDDYDTGAELLREAEPPVYLDLPAQQTAEPDPLFGPAGDIPGEHQVPQYAGYPEAAEYQQGDYRTGQFPVPDYHTGQFPIPAQESQGQDYPTGQFPQPDYHTGQFPVPEHLAAGGYPQDQNGYAAPAEAEPGVYVLPHQQHTHAPAPEAGA